LNTHELTEDRIAFSWNLFVPVKEFEKSEPQDALLHANYVGIAEPASSAGPPGIHPAFGHEWHGWNLSDTDPLAAMSSRPMVKKKKTAAAKLKEGFTAVRYLAALFIAPVLFFLLLHWFKHGGEKPKPLPKRDRPV